MIRVEAIKGFTLGRFNELKDIKRISVEREGELFIGDTFLCSEELADYLTGNNAKKDIVVRVIEVIPEEVKEPKIEEPKVEEKKEIKVEPKIKPTKKKYKK